MKKFSAAAVLVGFMLLVISAIPAIGPQYTVFEGAVFPLPEGTTAVTLQDPPAYLDHPLMVTKGAGGPAVDVSPLRAGTYSLALAPTGERIDLQLLSHKSGYLAAMGAFLLLLGLPGLLIRESALTMEGGGAVSGWIYLLVDQNGLNLPRVLLIIFFVPCAVVFLTLAFPLHQFPSLPDSVWQLLAYGGASAALGAVLEPGRSAANPAGPPRGPDATPATTLPYSQAAAAAIADPAPLAAAPDLHVIRRPSMTDLFRDPNGYGDISHFQTLVISASTAIVFLFSFFDDWVIPAIPDRVLELLAASLAVYVGVKGIKTLKQP